MKKNILSGLAILLVANVFSQGANKATTTINMGNLLARKFFHTQHLNESKSALKLNPAGVSPSFNQTDFGSSMAVSSATTNWQAISGSRNIYSVLYSQSKPLQYNDNLNAVTFIHRANETYVGQPSTPGSESGAMVAMITTNWGTTWDSTCIYSDVAKLARYPQGAIYSAPGNTLISSAYFVGSGPITDGNNWTGSWYASKQLGSANYNYTASAAPNAMQFLSNSSPLPSFGKHDYPCYSFVSTNDGKVRSLGLLVNDINGTDNATFGMRGAMITKGTFNTGVFNWTGDSLVPSVISRNDGSKHLYSTPIMAWNQAGTVGYVVFIGAAAGATNSNKSWQPIVYKTTNSGGSWANIQGIDFNSPSMAAIKAPLSPVSTNSVLKVPFFQVNEGLDAVVDANDKLHIVSTIAGCSNVDNDSLDYTHQYRSDNYGWPHSPGRRPYLYDFLGDGVNPWTVITIDSLSSEGPGANAGDPGYNENPWDADANYKVNSTARIQAGRSPDGKYILYTWAESDSNFTFQGKIWNTLPNVKARCLLIGTSTNTLSPTEINITKPVTGNNPVGNRAMFHFQSPVFKFVGLTAGPTCSVNLITPITVSSSNPFSQLTQNIHYYGSVNMDFACVNSVGLNENVKGKVNRYEVYPNPANSKATVAIDLKEETNVSLNVLSIIGTSVKSVNAKCLSGENKIEMNVSDLPSGIYLIQLNFGNTTVTRKLIIE